MEQIIKHPQYGAVSTIGGPFDSYAIVDGVQLRYDHYFDRWVEPAVRDQWTTGSYRNIAELVTVEIVKKYAEYDRRVRPMRSPEQFNDLMKSIRDVGFKEPLVLRYNWSNQFCVLVEGNHRLLVAEMLGLKCVPVRVLKSIYASLQPGRGGAFVEDPLIDPALPYIPDNLRPSQVFKELNC